MGNFYQFDTICAIATAFGNAGVGVIRISGKKSFEIINKIFSKKVNIPEKIYFGEIIDNSQKLDEVIILPFKNPKSYTGEDIIEIQCHGGVHILNNILNLVLKNGARMAEKGEFTKRAFLNHKMDLEKAEAVLDIIHAKTSNFAQKSAQNLFGALSLKITEIRQQIFNLLAKLTAAIDFPEDISEPEYSYIIETIENILSQIQKILEGANNSNIMRQGLKVAIVGRPNVGKSSLFNELLNMQRAIVTDIAGTTRDMIQETLDIKGIPITLIDTAGIRNEIGIDKVEKIGIDYSKDAIESADLVLFLYDASVKQNEEDEKIYALARKKPHLKIASKADLINKFEDKNSIYISILNKTNLEKLKNALFDIIIKNQIETEFITNQRQQDCLRKAQNSLILALDSAKNEQLQDLISIDVKSALLFLDEISGEVITDDILNS